MSSEKSHHIVVLGSSYAALKTSHRILKDAVKTKKSIRLTMVSTSTHFWYSVGAPRAMWSTDVHKENDSFIPIQPGFEKYPQGMYKFIHGRAVDVDTNRKIVAYDSWDDNDKVTGQDEVTYESLVVATGSRSNSPLFSLHGSHIATREAYRDLQARVSKLGSVMIVGTGPSGVETAGELGQLAQQKGYKTKVTLVSNGSHLLPAFRPALGDKAAAMLHKHYKVDIVYNKKFTHSAQDPATGKTIVTFHDGDTEAVDLLIEAVGRKPVTDFMPSALLTDRKQLKVDSFMRVEGADGVWAVGDVASLSNGTIFHVNFAVPVTAANVVSQIEGKGEGALKQYKPITSESGLVPVGSEMGVGALFGWKLPSCLVRMIKSKDMMFSKARPTADGSDA